MSLLLFLCTKNISKWLLTGKSLLSFNKSFMSPYSLVPREKLRGPKKTHAINWEPGIKPPWDVIPLNAHCSPATFPAAVHSEQMFSLPPLTGLSLSCCRGYGPYDWDTIYLELGFSCKIRQQISPHMSTSSWLCTGWWRLVALLNLQECLQALGYLCWLWHTTTQISCIRVALFFMWNIAAANFNYQKAYTRELVDCQ